MPRNRPTPGRKAVSVSGAAQIAKSQAAPAPKPTTSFLGGFSPAKPKPEKFIDSKTMQAMIKDAESQGVDPREMIQIALDRGYEIEQGGSVVKGIVGGALETSKAVPKLAATILKKPIVSGVSSLTGVPKDVVEQKFDKEVLNRKFGAEGKGAVPFAITKGIGDIAQTVGGTFGVSQLAQGTKLANVVKSVAGSGLPGKAAVGGAIGLGEVGLGAAISEQRLPTKGEAALGLTIGAGLPLIGAGLKAAAPKLQLSGLLNPKKLDDVKNSLLLEGVEEASKASPEDVASRMFSRGIKGDKQQIVQQLKEIAAMSKNTVDDVLSKSNTKHSVVQAKQAIALMKEQLENVPGLEKKAAQIVGFADQPSYTLSELNQIKRLTDDVRNIFKQGALGDVKAGIKAEGLANIRKGLKEFIEEVAQKEGLVGVEQGIKQLNNQTAIANSLRQAIARKESSDATREIIQFLGGKSPGAIIGGGVASQVGGPFDNSTTEGKILNIVAGAIAGGAIGSTKVKTNLANALSKVPQRQQSEIYEWMLSRGTKELSQQAAKSLDSVTSLLINQ